MLRPDDNQPMLPQSLLGTLFALASFVATFLVARHLSKRFRKRREQREETKARAGESRQVRRARERKQD